jgi:hypothetical protein
MALQSMGSLTLRIPASLISSKSFEVSGLCGETPTNPEGNAATATHGAGTSTAKTANKSTSLRIDPLL